MPGDRTAHDGVAAFAVLSDGQRSHALQRMRRREVRSGEWLFRAGDEPDALYVVVSGRLEVIAEHDGGRIRLVGRNGVVGELSLLTGRPRSAGVRAVRDSETLVLDDATFRSLLADRAEFALELARGLADTLAHSVAAPPPTNTPPRTIALVALRGNAEVDLLAEALAPALPARVLRPRGGIEEAWGTLLDEAESHGEQVILSVGGDAAPAWRRFCLAQSDRHVVIAAGEPPRHAEMSALHGCDLVLSRPVGGAWLDALRPARTHIVSGGTGIRQLARRLSGRAVGIVLSGGGARGLAHIGVLEELDRAGVTIDRVGGCSMGSFVGAQFAAGRDPASIAACATRELVERRPFADYTLSRAGLIRGRRAEAMLGRVFGARHVEGLSRDFFCVSADLLAAEVVVHRSGPLATAVGASMAMPGLIAPRRMNGRLLVDGGVLDNLPVGAMADAGEGPVLASDVMGRRLSTDDSDALAGRSPSVLETVARATTLASWRTLRETERRAALVLRPALPDVGLLAFEHLPLAVAAGRAAVRDAVRSGALASALAV